MLRRLGILPLIYVAVGVLVATGTVGDQPNSFASLGTVEELIEAILTVLLWPLVLAGTEIEIGGR